MWFDSVRFDLIEVFDFNAFFLIAVQAFALEREDPAKADHLFTQSSIGFLQAMRSMHAPDPHFACAVVHVR
jgi:hypothetical protein